MEEVVDLVSELTEPEESSDDSNGLTLALILLTCPIMKIPIYKSIFVPTYDNTVFDIP